MIITMSFAILYGILLNVVYSYPLPGINICSTVLTFFYLTLFTIHGGHKLRSIIILVIVYTLMFSSDIQYVITQPNIYGVIYILADLSMLSMHILMMIWIQKKSWISSHFSEKFGLPSFIDSLAWFMTFYLANNAVLSSSCFSFLALIKLNLQRQSDALMNLYVSPFMMIHMSFVGLELWQLKVNITDIDLTFNIYEGLAYISFVLLNVMILLENNNQLPVWRIKVPRYDSKKSLEFISDERNRAMTVSSALSKIMPSTNLDESFKDRTSGDQVLLAL
jgi:hypothetical protein